MTKKELKQMEILMFKFLQVRQDSYAVRSLAETTLRMLREKSDKKATKPKQADAILMSNPSMDQVVDVFSTVFGEE